MACSIRVCRKYVIRKQVLGSLTVCPSHRLCAGHRGLLWADQDQRGQGEQEADLRGPGLATGV